MAVAIPWVMLAISAYSAVSQHQEADERAENEQKAQDEYNERMKEETLAKLKDVNAAKSNELENVSKDKLQNDLDFLEARSTSRNLGGALGAKGQSFDLLMQGLEQEHQQSASDITQGHRENLKQLDRQSDNVLRGGENSIDNRVISRPSAFSGAANVIGSGYQGYQAGQAVRTSYEEWR